jgi:hypothetical protein
LNKSGSGLDDTPECKMGSMEVQRLGNPQPVLEIPEHNSWVAFSWEKMPLVTFLRGHNGFAGASARLEGVNKPELLPTQYSPVIDVAGFLTSGEVRRSAPYAMLYSFPQAY